MISSSELRKTLKLAKKFGLKRLKTPDFEFEFGLPTEAPVNIPRLQVSNATFQAPNATVTVSKSVDELQSIHLLRQTGEPMPSDEEFLHWSTPLQPIPDDEGEPK
jgi:hypothetical protein